MPLRRFAALALISLASVGFAACGADEDVRHGETEGVYVTAGDLKYQVQISRPLNPADYEDRDFLHGVPTSEALAGDQTWFGVFIRAFNETEQAHEAAAEFVIEDTTGEKFTPIAVDKASNPFVYRPQLVGPQKGDNAGPDWELPKPNSAGRTNPTQGGLLLFKMPTSALENRPLQLHITAPDGGDDTATVELDV